LLMWYGWHYLFLYIGFNAQTFKRAMPKASPFLF
jgi:hypothetical protein